MYVSFESTWQILATFLKPFMRKCIHFKIFIKIYVCLNSHKILESLKYNFIVDCITLMYLFY